jgi:hypothetical protein
MLRPPPAEVEGVQVAVEGAVAAVGTGPEAAPQYVDALRHESAAPTVDDLAAMGAAKGARASLRFGCNIVERLAISPSCLLCRPRPEPDAIFCSPCGRWLPKI